MNIQAAVQLAKTAYSAIPQDVKTAAIAAATTAASSKLSGASDIVADLAAGKFPSKEAFAKAIASSAPGTAGVALGKISDMYFALPEGAQTAFQQQASDAVKKGVSAVATRVSPETPNDAAMKHLKTFMADLEAMQAAGQTAEK
jgi:phosphopantetheinyl transferase (holo-ACP synthase)